MEKGKLLWHIISFQGIRGLSSPRYDLGLTIVAHRDRSLLVFFGFKTKSRAVCTMVCKGHVESDQGGGHLLFNAF